MGSYPRLSDLSVAKLVLTLSPISAGTWRAIRDAPGRHYWCAFRFRHRGLVGYFVVHGRRVTRAAMMMLSLKRSIDSPCEDHGFGQQAVFQIDYLIASGLDVYRSGNVLSWI
jgi:hypothetical protein